MDFLELINESSILSDELQNDINQLEKIKDSIFQSHNTQQVFRTRTEMEISILNDIKFPSPDSKYWQSVREQDVMFTELIRLSFNYRKNEVGIKKIEQQLKKELDIFDKELLQIELEEKIFGRLEMKRIQKDRIREILEWQNIKDNLGLEMKYSTEDVNEHQLVSYTQRWIQQQIQMGSSGSPPERWNLLGQLDKGIKMCKEKQCLDKVLKIFDNDIKKIVLNGHVVSDLLSL